MPFKIGSVKTIMVQNQKYCTPIYILKPAIIGKLCFNYKMREFVNISKQT